MCWFPSSANRQMQRDAGREVRPPCPMVRAGLREGCPPQTAIRPVWTTFWIRGFDRSNSALRPSLI
jgi:hypothetical protein